MNRQARVIGAVSRRTLIAGGASALGLGVVSLRGPLAFAQEEPEAEGTPVDKAARREKIQGFDFIWRATSPATHLGDEYSLILTNAGPAPQEILAQAAVMDHRNHVNTLVIDETITLDPGASHDLTAANDYGTANHFTTRLFTKTETGIELTVTLTTADGVQAATFNQRAFMVDSRDDLAAAAAARRDEMSADRRRRHEAGEHGAHEEAEPGATPAT